MFNRAGIFCGDHWYQINQLCNNSPYRNSDFFINDFFKKTLFRRLFSGGIRVPTYLRGKTREIELVTSLTSCQGILTSFFPRKTHVIELVTIITSNHFILTSFFAKKS